MGKYFFAMSLFAMTYALHKLFFTKFQNKAGQMSSYFRLYTYEDANKTNYIINTSGQPVQFKISVFIAGWPVLI